MSALRGLVADLDGRVEESVTASEVAEWLEAASMSAEAKSAGITIGELAESQRYGGGALSAEVVRDHLLKLAPVFDAKIGPSLRSNVLLLALCLLLGSASVSAQASDVFQNAQAEFAAGNYEESANLLASINTETFENGYVLYNEGNAWLRAGQLGKAIAAYRRAQYFLPSDANLERNLGHALAKRPQVLTEEAELSLADRLLFLKRFCSPRTQLYATILCALLAVGFAMLR
jgi:tetratricopeptide (TPR) repeat protein